MEVVWCMVFSAWFRINWGESGGAQIFNTTLLAAAAKFHPDGLAMTARPINQIDCLLPIRRG